MCSAIFVLTRTRSPWSFGYYDHVLRLEATSGRWYFEALCAPEREDEIEHRYAELTSRLANRPLTATYRCGEFLATPDRQAHIDSVARAIELIKRGDIFQANITMRLETSFSGDPLDFFCRGSEQLKALFAAFIRLPEGAIASFSPELFLRRRGNAVLTSPIKGTSPPCGLGRHPWLRYSPAFRPVPGSCWQDRRFPWRATPRRSRPARSPSHR